MGYDLMESGAPTVVALGSSALCRKFGLLGSSSGERRVVTVGRVFSLKWYG